MSRIGKKIIEIPKDAKLSVKDGIVTTEGPKGKLTVAIPEGISYTLEDGSLSFARSSDQKHVRAIHGLTRALVASNIEGVTKGFAKTLKIEGVGFRAEMRGPKLLLFVGYSHPILFIPPKEITFETPQPTLIKISGHDKQLVGQIAAKIRKIRPPEPYKGKGIRYENEQIRRKAGKSGVK